MNLDLLADSCEFAPPVVPPGTAYTLQESLTHRPPLRRKPPTRRTALAVLLLAPLAGCDLGNGPVSGPSIVGYNHTTNRSIYIFTVDGHMGANLAPETGGGNFSCCAVIPRYWRPGTKVTVRWRYQNWRDVPAPEPRWWEAVVEVPKYRAEDISRLAVHFYPDHKVKVLVTWLAIKHPDYPAELKWDAPTPVDVAVGHPLYIEEPPRPPEVDRPEFTGAPTSEPASDPAPAASVPN